MIAAIKRLFTTPEVEPTQDQLRLAGAALLLEVGFADFALGDEERAAFQSQLSERFELSGSELETLTAQALAQHDLRVSLHEQVNLINERYDAGAKRQLIRDLWQMAYADGHLHHQEEAVIRRLADLLHVPHRDFIRTKFQANGQA